MNAYRDGRQIIMCDGCFKTIKKLTKRMCVQIGGREAHVHAACEARARANAPKRAT